MASSSATPLDIQSGGTHKSSLMGQSPDKEQALHTYCSDQPLSSHSFTAVATALHAAYSAWLLTTSAYADALGAACTPADNGHCFLHRVHLLCCI